MGGGEATELTGKPEADTAFVGLRNSGGGEAQYYCGCTDELDDIAPKVQVLHDEP